ncbi:MAG: S-adenosylmethionine:tRNA ribosyltransferase-isomerase [Candidatus Omnitrophota bacterium]|jgi:S-adenosylmethionine:tRNA ribosyltransferase-isomerase
MPDLEKIGHMPLPPYIKRCDDEDDRNHYQTVYAKEQGSVAAPTAGLHFTKELMSSLLSEGHSFEEVTLHVNYGTFKPVEVDDITEHKMHTERYSVVYDTYKQIKAAKEEGRSIVGVGTTSCRVLESIAQTGQLKGETNIFIYPGFSFKMVDILITNFHLPMSTLLMLVSAFASKDLIKRAYQEAIEKKYRFYSYGDAMIVL